ncbi:MAG: hypothetical protein JRJ47_00930 [Deltaproteobacteria bacterium]|nr:hypothetical protein [Deltaproteobacteria bacterium]
MFVWASATGTAAETTDSVSKKENKGHVVIDCLDTSHRLSVYRDIAKVKEDQKKLFRYSGFSGKQCREFGLDYALVCEFERSRPREAFVFAIFVIEHLLKKFSNEDPKLLKEFREIIDDPVGTSNVGDFLLTVVPRYSFPEMQIVMLGYSLGREYTMGEYAVEYMKRQERPTTKFFYKALDDLWDGDPKTTYDFNFGGGKIPQEIVNEYLDVFYAFYKNFYLPVFGITVYNPTASPVAVERVGIEVIEYSEHPGSRNFAPKPKTENLHWIDVPNAKGNKTIELSKPLQIGSKTRRTVNVGLAPTGMEADYLLRIKLHYNGGVLESEKITLSM